MNVDDAKLKIDDRMSPINEERMLSEAEASDRDQCSHRDVGCIQNLMMANCSTSNNPLGREADEGDLDGDLYQDHHVTDHFVVSVAIDLLPCPVLSEFDDAKNGDQVETKSGSDDNDPPTSLMKYKLGRDTPVAHTIDFVEAYHHVQVAIVPMTMDDI